MLAQEFLPMKLTGFALAAALVLTAGSAAAQTNVGGDWDVSIQSPQGTNTIRVTFKQDGEKLSGLLKSPMGEMPFEGGTLVGSDLKFAFSVPVQGQPLEITMTGKVDGPTIAGKAQFGGFGEGDWTAKRVDTAATAAVPTATEPPTGTAPPPAGTVSTGISGKWDVTVKTQMGDLPISAQLTEAAGKVTGTLEGPAGLVDVAGTFDGTAIKLAFTAKTPQGDIPIEMSGELNGDSIVNGKAEFGGMGQGEWTAKRKQ
jgi:hypothetical protein